MPLDYHDLSKSKWEAVRTLTDDHNTIQKADKGLCVVTWDRNDYIAEAECWFKNQVIYKKLLSKRISFVT